MIVLDVGRIAPLQAPWRIEKVTTLLPLRGEWVMNVVAVSRQGYNSSRVQGDDPQAQRGFLNDARQNRCYNLHDARCESAVDRQFFFAAGR
jgi:hypothetical protein